jgi:hypothetical protein
MRNKYLKTDHWQDAVASLESAQEFCVRITNDEYQWKWLLIATHSCVQGFMAIALDHGNGLLVMRDNIREKWLKALEQDTQFPIEKMDYFLSLYGKVKSDAVCVYVGSKKFISLESHDYSMSKLNELRNNFIHFSPKGWSIELIGLPSVILKCIEVAKFLAFDSFNTIWHDGELRDRAERAFTFLIAELKTIETIYASLNIEES